jgi:hypothetical protein
VLEVRRLLPAISLLFAGLFLWNMLARWWGQTPETLSFKDFLTLALSLLSHLGSKAAPAAESRPARAFRLPAAFTSGVYGGLAGGTLAGLIIGIGYFVSQRTTDRPVPWSIVLEIVPYAAVVGTVTGGAALLFIYWFGHAASEGGVGLPALVVNELTGGALGGAMGGLAVGALGGYWFGQRAYYAPDPALLIWATVVGGVAVVLGALLYEFRGNARNLRRAVAMAVPITLVVGALGIWLLLASGLYAWIYRGDTTDLAIRAGAAVGSGMGLTLGLQIGLTLLLYRRLEVGPAGS